MTKYTTVSDASFNIKIPHYGFAFQVGPYGGHLIRHSDTFTTIPHSPTEAEMMAIGHAVNCLFLNFPIKQGDIIIVHTDCVAAVNYLKYQAFPKHQHNPRLRALTLAVFRLLNQKVGVRHEIRLMMESNKFMKWCHYQSKYNGNRTEQIK